LRRASKGSDAVSAERNPRLLGPRIASSYTSVVSPLLPPLEVEFRLMKWVDMVLCNRIQFGWYLKGLFTVL
jgi:hypothetical protein